VGLVLALLIASAVGWLGSPARVAQATAGTSSTLSITSSTLATASTASTASTLNDVLVPGDGTQGAESTTSTTIAVETTDGGVSDSTIVWLIVGGLVLVALLVAFLTWRYWVATRPTRSEREEPPATASSASSEPVGST
jgi:uncharacterized membrane protein